MRRFSIAICVLAVALSACQDEQFGGEIGRERLCAENIHTFAGLKKVLAKLVEQDPDGGGRLAVAVDTLRELLKHPSYRGGPSAPDNIAEYERVRAYYKKLCDGHDLGPELFSRSGRR
jgi:hypothetical protein